MRISLTSASTGNRFLQRGDMRVVETTRPVGRKGHEMPLAERVVERPRHIVGQALRPHLVIDGVLAALRRIALEILAHLGGAVRISLAGLPIYSERSLTS